MGFKLHGMDKTKGFLRKLKSDFQAEMGDSLERCGEIVRAHVVKGIRDQKWPMAELSKKTMRRKAKKGLTPGLKLIAQGDYMTSFAVRKKSWDKVRVGTTMPQARALEFGFEKRNLPARPHLRQAFEDARADVKTELRQSMESVFRP